MKIIAVNLLLQKRNTGMLRKVVCGLIAMVLLALILPSGLHAAAVGRFTLIKGQVDLLKGGKPPGIPAQVQDGVEPGDVIRTKMGSKAQLSMVDASVITLCRSPAWPSPIINIIPPGKSAGPCCASFGAWCTPRSTASSRPK